jgi:hypothetical protein
LLQVDDLFYDRGFMSEAVTAYDSLPDDYKDPRAEQLISLVRELAAERVQAGLVCLKAGDDRASSFFQDAIEVEKHLQNLIECLGL